MTESETSDVIELIVDGLLPADNRRPAVQVIGPYRRAAEILALFQPEVAPPFAITPEMAAAGVAIGHKQVEWETPEHYVAAIYWAMRAAEEEGDHVDQSTGREAE